MLKMLRISCLVKMQYLKYASHNEGHKARNGWYLGMVVTISSILSLLILYSKNFVGR